MSDAITTLPPPPSGEACVPDLADPRWHTPLRECPFVLIDCEMTGVDPGSDSLLEVALCRIRNGHVEGRFSSLVQCTKPSCTEALLLHGIDGEASESAPSFDAIADTVLSFLDGAVAVMHDPTLDVSFLEAALARRGTPFRFGAVLDTVVLARRAFFAHSYALSALAHTLGLRPRRWHRAAEDVACLEQLFASLVVALRPRDALDLWQVRAGQRGPVMVRDHIETLIVDAQHSASLVSMTVRGRGSPEEQVIGVIERYTAPHCLVAVQQDSTHPQLRFVRADRILRLDLE